jgi:hypothetical protein
MHEGDLTTDNLEGQPLQTASYELLDRKARSLESADNMLEGERYRGSHGDQTLSDVYGEEADLEEKNTRTL